MLIRNVVSTLVLAASTIAPISSHAASLFGHGAPNSNASTANVSKAKMVKFTLVNKTSAPLTVLINDESITLAANSEKAMRVAEGSDIFGEDHTTVKLHVTGELAGNTVSFR